MSATAPALSPTSPKSALAGLVGRLRSEAATTPGRMRTVGLVALVFIALAWGLGFFTIQQRQRAVHTIAAELSPVVISSENIQSLLSGADASSANSFLAGGVEPADQRARYLQDLQQAQDEVTRATAAPGASAQSQAALRTLAEAVPTYAGLVEAARANNRQGFPVGAGYLRRATAEVHGTLIPAAQTVNAQSVGRLQSVYGTAAGNGAVIALLAVDVALVVVLIAAQVFLRRRTNRIFNVGALVATVLAGVLIGWTLFGVLGQGSQVRAARGREDTLRVLAVARATAFRAKSDESFALIARGNGATQYQDFDAAMTQIGTVASGKGLLNQATSDAGSDGAESAAIGNADRALQSYRSLHSQIQALDTGGQSSPAITKALAAGPGSANAAFDAFDTAVTGASNLASAAFTVDINQAGNRLGGLAIATSVGFLAVAILVLYGLGRRIREYR